MLRYTTDRES